MGRPSRVEVYQRMQDAIVELRERYGGLPTPLEAEDIWADLWHEEAHNSTALEGNTLIRREVEKLLAEGKAVGAKPLRDYMEVRGYGDAAKWVYGQALEPGAWQTDEILTLQEVRHVHHMAMVPVWTVSPPPEASDAESPGNFRRHEIAAFSEGMTPPPWVEVDCRMGEWIATTERIRKPSIPLPEVLATIHNDFERIHPFLDGNGRTGRLILNLLLGRLGYPPAIIYKRDRERYLRAMRRADRSEYGPLAELIARGVTANLYRFVVPAVAGPAKLVPLTSLAKPTLTEGALRAAAVRGRLRAVRGDDGRWRSSRKWVEQYETTKHMRQSHHEE
jgi:hypothetical protein